MDVGAKLCARVIAGAGVTASAAAAGAELETFCASVTAPAALVSMCEPVTTLVTVTVTVQVAPAASVPALRANVFAWVAAVTAPVPQVVAASGTAATSTPAGNASVNASDVNAIAPGDALAIVTVRIDVPPLTIDAGAKAFASVSFRVPVTVSVALAVPALFAP
jgi:hypothetical protein